MYTRMMMCFIGVIGLSFFRCATFKSELTGQFQPLAEKNYHADKVSVCFIFSHYRQTVGLDAIPKLDTKYERIRGFDDFFHDALQELSNVHSYATFTDDASDVNEPERRALRDSLMRQHDFVIHMKFKREKSFTNYFLGEIVSTLSLTLLPVPYWQTYAVQAEIFDAEQRLMKTYTRKISLTKWVQSMLIFFYPFHPESRKREEIYVQSMHDIFRQIETEKVLKKQ